MIFIGIVWICVFIVGQLGIVLPFVCQEIFTKGSQGGSRSTASA